MKPDGIRRNYSKSENERAEKSRGDREAFEDFCSEYAIDYYFEYLGYGFKNHETHKAFICWKYGRGTK